MVESRKNIQPVNGDAVHHPAVRYVSVSLRFNIPYSDANLASDSQKSVGKFEFVDLFQVVRNLKLGAKVLCRAELDVGTQFQTREGENGRFVAAEHQGNILGIQAHVFDRNVVKNFFVNLGKLFGGWRYTPGYQSGLFIHPGKTLCKNK